jgi:PAS domain S-box-containing protein
VSIEGRRPGAGERERSRIAASGLLEQIVNVELAGVVVLAGGTGVRNHERTFIDHLTQFHPTTMKASHSNPAAPDTESGSSSELESLRARLLHAEAENRVLAHRLASSERAERHAELEHLRNVSAHLPALVAYIDVEQHYVFASDRYAALFRWTPASIIGRSVREVMGPEIWGRIQHHVENALAGQVVHFNVNDTERADSCVFEVTYTPDLDAHGSLRGVYLLLIDVKEQRRAESEIRKLNVLQQTQLNQFETLLRLVPVGIGIAHDAECARITANPYFAQLFGEPVDGNFSFDDKGRSDQAFRIMSDGVPLPLDELPMRIAAGRGLDVRNMELEIVRGDDSVRHVLGSASPFFDDEEKVRGCFGAFVDITERKHAEAASEFLASSGEILAQSLALEPTLRRVTNLVVPRYADWCFIDLLDEHGGFQRTAVSTADPARVDLARRMERYYRPNGTESAASLSAATGQSIIAEHVPESVLDAVARDPEHRAMLTELDVMSYLCVPLVSRGRTIGVLSYVNSRGSRTLDHDDLRLAEELGRRAALAVENARLYSEAQTANRVKDEFLATLSHELRTPLTAVLGWASVLRLDRSDEAMLETGLEAIERSARVQAQLIEDVLDVSRIVAGKLRLYIEPVRFHSVIEEAIAKVRATAEARGVSLRVSGDREAHVLGDSARLQQVVWNLVNNAIKFTPPSGAIDVIVTADGDHVVMQVRDEGEGIAPDFLPHIFERFTQGDSSTTRRHGGLGLGLAIARHLVTLHAGHISVESEGSGKGATFTVVLPRSVAAASVPEREAAGNELPDLRGKFVIIVDDERDTRAVIEEILTRCGAEVVASSSVAEARESVMQRLPHLIISDIAMPDEDGYALVRWLRERETATENARVPAIALSAFGRPADRAQVLAAGFDEHLQKPIEAIRLAQSAAKFVR